MAAPPITERHKPHFHRRAPMVEPVRVATTANITIATALNVGDTIDGVTLADGDRVLVKDQSTGSQKGIYTAGATPTRAYDQSTDDPNYGFLVLVLEGSTNGLTLWKNTNVSAPTIDTTALTFALATSSVSLALDDLSDVTITSAATGDRLRYNGSAWVNSALIWKPVMVLDPTSGNYLPVTTGAGEIVMTEAL